MSPFTVYDADYSRHWPQTSSGLYLFLDNYFSVDSQFVLAFEFRPQHLTGLFFHVRGHKTRLDVFLMETKVKRDQAAIWSCVLWSFVMFCDLLCFVIFCCVSWSFVMFCDLLFCFVICCVSWSLLCFVIFCDLLLCFAVMLILYLVKDIFQYIWKLTPFSNISLSTFHIIATIR